MRNILIRRLGILLFGFILVLLTGSNAVARTYLVAGAGASIVNGLYVEDGTFDTTKDDWGTDKGPQPLFRKGAYRLGYRGCILEWVIVTGESDDIVSCGLGTGYIYGNTSEGVYDSSSGYWYPPEGQWGGCATNPASSPTPFPTVTLVYKLTVTASGSGNVTRDDPGISGFPDYYYVNTPVQLTANADPGWEFTGWSKDHSGTTNPDTISMNADKNVTATFGPLEGFGLYVVITGEGNVDLVPRDAGYEATHIIPPGGAGNYFDGMVIDVAATPDSPYWEFTGWSGDLSGTANPETITLDSNKNITATFTLKDSDGDGISDQAEDAGPNGGDANNDGTLDSQQPNVVCRKTLDGQHDVVFVVEDPPGATLAGCEAVANPHPDDYPSWVDFPYGFFEFTIQNVGAGGAATLSVHLPQGAVQDTYYKYGPTPDNPNNHWYNFMFEEATQTGAEFNDNVITLSFIDGERGDDDLNNSNGTIYDDGGPGLMSGVDTPGGPTGNAGGTSGGGNAGAIGGCFVETLTH